MLDTIVYSIDNTKSIDVDVTRWGITTYKFYVAPTNYL